VSITINPGNSINDNLIAWWPMDEGSGTVAYDVSGNSHHGTLTNGPTWGSGPPGCGAVVFDGDDDYIETAGTDVLPLTGNMTACCFVYMNNMDQNISFICKGNVGPGYPQPWVLMSNPDYGGGWAYLSVGDGGSQMPVYSYGGGGGTSSPLSSGSWFHVAATNNAGELRIYIDGILAGVVDASGQDITDGDYPILLGSREGGSPFYLNGLMSQVRVWDRALSGAEIAAIYANPYFGAVSMPVAMASFRRRRM